MALWNRLPEQMATHWGADGVVDGYSGRAFAVFALPLSMLALHWFCIWVTAKDPGNQNQNQKATGMILWICPFFSLFAGGVIYFASFTRVFAMKAVTLLPLGILFVVIGNYLPKLRQNRTMGIKIKWTLADEENWNATHRLGGKVWVAGGLLLLLSVFLPEELMAGAMFVLIVLMVAIPMIYSWQYYKKQVSAGKVPKKAEISMGKGGKWIGVIACLITVFSLVLVVVLGFTGDLQVQYDDTSFTIEASYWSDLTVEYAAIDSVEYREYCEPGRRTNGFGSPRLSMGTFYNEEFGTYTRYSYTACKACVVVKSGEKTLVIGGADVERTKEIYQEILDGRENLSQYK